jgi:pimeloyl-ACP methyl ester carboxylesterase
MWLRWIAGLSVVFALALVAPTSGASKPPNRPIYFIHGWNLNADTDCAATWGAMTKNFNAWGLKGTRDLANLKAGQIPFHTVAYYHGDKNCNTRIDADGDHSKSLPLPAAPLPGPQPHREGSSTPNTPIEHLAYHLAWNIYDTYSSRNVPIDVVAHSMGGLIIRYALAATERHVADFPPYLLVEDVVTLGTPHGGSRGHRFAPSLQGSEMDPGSSFIKSLVKFGFNPQGRGGTDWTTAGSDDDTAVAADRAVGTDRDRDPRDKYIGSQHKVWYTAVNHLEHSDYYKVATKNATAIAWVATKGKPFGSHPLAIVYPMRMAYFALQSSGN